jgi:hypothetical protein
MKIIVLAIILLSLYLIYRLSFPGQAGNRPGNEALPPKPPDGDEAVVKSRKYLVKTSILTIWTLSRMQTFTSTAQRRKFPCKFWKNATGF